MPLRPSAAARTVLAATVAVGLGACERPARPDVLDVPLASASPTPSSSTFASPVPPTPSASPSPSPAVSRDLITSRVTGRFPPELGAEISGAAAGRAVEGVWLADDEPGTDGIHLVALDGRVLATVRLQDVETVNIEDLAVGPCPATPADSCVHVADIGDNVGARSSVAVLSFPEEVVAAASGGGEIDVTPTVRSLRYEDGAVDAEALVVAPDGGLIVLDRTPEEAGVHIAARGEDVLTRAATLPLPEPRNRMLAQVAGHVVTAADLSPDGSVLALRTYDQLVLLRAPAGTPLRTGEVGDLPGWLVQDLGRVPSELQGESVALLRDGRVVTVAEGSTAITVTTPPG